MPRSNFIRNPDVVFTSKIKACVFMTNLRQDQVAKKIGKSTGTTNKYLNAPSEMTLGTFKALIKAVNIPKEEVIKYLYGG